MKLEINKEISGYRAPGKKKEKLNGSKKVVEIEQSLAKNI